MLLTLAFFYYRVQPCSHHPRSAIPIICIALSLAVTPFCPQYRDHPPTVPIIETIQFLLLK